MQSILNIINLHRGPWITERPLSYRSRRSGWRHLFMPCSFSSFSDKRHSTNFGVVGKPVRLGPPDLSSSIRSGCPTFFSGMANYFSYRCRRRLLASTVDLSAAKSTTLPWLRWCFEGPEMASSFTHDAPLASAGGRHRWFPQGPLCNF